MKFKLSGSAAAVMFVMFTALALQPVPSLAQQEKPASAKELPQLPGIEQLRQLHFPKLFKSGETVEKGPKAFFVRNLETVADNAYIFLKFEANGSVSVDWEKRNAWLEKWKAKGANLGDIKDAREAYKQADILSRKAIQDLGERFNYYYDPEEVRVDDHMRHQTSVGIGVQLQMQHMQEALSKLPDNAKQEDYEKALTVTKEHRLVLTPLKDGPAEKAGILRGDILRKVDGEDIEDGKHTMKQVIFLVSGTKGSTVEITVERKKKELDKDKQETGKEVTVEETIQVTRDEFKSRVTHTTPADKDGIVVMRLDTFMADDTAKEWMEDLSEFVAKRRQENKPTMLIMDLRNNGGGRVDHGVNIIAMMMERGTVLTMKTRESSGVRTERWTVTPDALLYTYPAPANPSQMIALRGGKRTLVLPPDVPLVILVNEHSASCSELVTKSLRVGRPWTKVCGVNTYGKGVVNRPIDLASGDPAEPIRRMAIGIGRFYPGVDSVNGTDVDIDWEGVHPDLESKWEKPKKPEDDNQLDDAKKLALQEYALMVKAQAEQKKLHDDTVAKKKAEFKAQIEAREKAEQEARKKAEEARKKAEDEARKKAEEEARKKAKDAGKNAPGGKDKVSEQPKSDNKGVPPGPTKTKPGDQPGVGSPSGTPAPGQQPAKPAVPPAPPVMPPPNDDDDPDL